MKKVCWPYFDPEFESLMERIQGPSCKVCIDNECCKECTVAKVDSVNNQVLLQVVQVLSDMNLVICKSCLFRRQMVHGWTQKLQLFGLHAVFHVRDERGNKVTDQKLINYMQQALSPQKHMPKQKQQVLRSSTEVKKTMSSETLGQHTAIEMSCTDRPGLFSEISAVLTDLRCNVVEAHAWSHNERIACIVRVSDESARHINDPHRLARIKDHLSTLLQADIANTNDDDVRRGGQVKTDFEGDDCAVSHQGHQLHQLMLAGHDYETKHTMMQGRVAYNDHGGRKKNIVSIDRCNEKGYSVVHVDCEDRPKLIFDIVCALTDMQFVVFHASTLRHGSLTSQEYYIRHLNGCALKTESERQLVTKCLEAAIERRVCEGVRLEVYAHDRLGLLSNVTRLLREHRLTVARADVATQGEEVANVFYMQDISGNAVDMETVNTVRKEIAPLALEVREKSPIQRTKSTNPPKFSFSHMIRSQIEHLSHNFIAIN